MAQAAMTSRDYFYLASHKFPQRGSFLKSWKIKTSETYYRHGLIAVSFINAALKQLVISFQVLDNVEITQESFDCAKDFVKEAKQLAHILGYEVSYTGKFLGGTIAELCAIQDQLPCYTFESQSIYDFNLH